MEGNVRVIVYYRQPPGPAEDVILAYRAACPVLAGTPGLAGHELLAPLYDGDRYALLMLWQELSDFLTWEGQLRASGHPSPLRRFQDRARPGGHYEIYEVRAQSEPRASARASAPPL